MKQKRLIIFFSILILIPSITYLVAQLAQGYRPDLTTRTLKPTGLLVARSSPRGAEVSVAGETHGTTDTTVNLDPGLYAISISKTGYHSWKKTLTIEKKLITIADVLLFPQSLTPLPVKSIQTSALIISPDQAKLAFLAPLPTPSPAISPQPTPVAQTVPQVLQGIYTIDLSDSPLNLNRDPKIISPPTAVINWSTAFLTWSPDSRQIMARLPRDSKCKTPDEPKNPCTLQAVYLLDPGRRPDALPKNIIGTHKKLLTDWQNETEIRSRVILDRIPKTLSSIFAENTDDIRFSPDESKILYLATSSATLPDEVIPPIPAANSQPQNRTLIPGQTYIYDIKEDRNFAITPDKPLPSPSPKPKSKPQAVIPPSPSFSLSWFPSSRHILKAQLDSLSVFEYDYTNQTVLYSGQLINFHAYPSTSGSRIYILLQSEEDPKTPGTLYFLDLKP